MIADFGMICVAHLFLIDIVLHYIMYLIVDFRIRKGRKDSTILKMEDLEPESTELVDSTSPRSIVRRFTAGVLTFVTGLFFGGGGGKMAPATCSFGRLPSRRKLSSQ